jgi:hypothetical protein
MRCAGLYSIQPRSKAQENIAEVMRLNALAAPLPRAAAMASRMARMDRQVMPRTGARA